MGTMLLKKNILTKKENFQKLSGEHMEGITKHLTPLVNGQTNKKVLHGIAEIVSLLFHLRAQYVQFFQYLEQFKASNEKAVILFIIDCLDEIAPYTFTDELLAANAGKFEEYFSLYMQNSDLEIQNAAACTFISFIAFIND